MIWSRAIAKAKTGSPRRLVTSDRHWQIAVWSACLTIGLVIARVGRRSCSDLPFADLPDEQRACHVRSEIGPDCPRITSRRTAYFIRSFNAIARFKSFAEK